MTINEAEKYANEVCKKFVKEGDAETFKAFLIKLSKATNLTQYNKIKPQDGLMISNQKEQKKLKEKFNEFKNLTPERNAVKLFEMNKKAQIRFINKLAKLIFQNSKEATDKIHDFCLDNNLSIEAKHLIEEIYKNLDV